MAKARHDRLNADLKAGLGGANLGSIPKAGFPAKRSVSVKPSDPKGSNNDPKGSNDDPKGSTPAKTGGHPKGSTPGQVMQLQNIYEDSPLHSFKGFRYDEDINKWFENMQAKTHNEKVQMKLNVKLNG